MFPAPPRGEPPRAAGIPSALRGTELGEALVPVVPDDVVTVDAPDVVGGLEPCDVAGPDWLVEVLSSVDKVSVSGACSVCGADDDCESGGGRSLMTAVEILSMVMEPGPSSINTTGLCAVRRAGPAAPKGPLLEGTGLEPRS